MRFFAILSLVALAQATVMPAAIDDTLEKAKAAAQRAKAAAEAAKNAPRAPEMLNVPRDCAAGTYQCWTGVGSDKETESQVQVCSTAGVWITSAICGGTTCCSESDGKAWCKC